ncbi:phosphotransferase [Ruania halotolerans]|uniref:phosphotransferase n=1 Tax=Ruania halotolerans TaxID=2897773 RepID=UPI001E426E8E|nr:phosphotransferase [Ruania halotolerans]
MPETTRSPLALAALATVAIPGLDVIATRPPRNPGADFDVVGVLDAARRRWIVRAPRRAAAGASLEAEVALLTVLGAAVDAGQLRFDVPRPAGFAPLPEGGRAMVYPELLGQPLDVDQLAHGPGLAAQVGRSIASLHEIDPAVLTDAGLPAYDADSYRRRRLSEVDEAAATGYVPAALLRRWEHALEDVALWRFRATPVHGDLAAEHVLVADGEVTAILDWSDARVADPADDLAWLLSTAPEAALDSILEAYALARTESADEHLADRALLAGELAVVRWLMHGVRIRDGQVVDEAIEMLSQLENDVAGEGPIGRVEPVVTDWVDDTAEDQVDEEISAVDEESPEREDTPAIDEGASSIHEVEDPRVTHADDVASGRYHRAGALTGDDDETADHPELLILREPAAGTSPRRGDDETPTAQLPPVT